MKIYSSSNRTKKINILFLIIFFVISNWVNKLGSRNTMLKKDNGLKATKLSKLNKDELNPIYVNNCLKLNWPLTTFVFTNAGYTGFPVIVNDLRYHKKDVENDTKINMPINPYVDSFFILSIIKM